MIRFDGLANFRDAGLDSMRSGVLFRSGAPSRITARDRIALGRLDLKLICDLRAPSEAKRRAWPTMSHTTRIVNVPLHDHTNLERERRKILGMLFGRGGEQRLRELLRDYYHHIAFERAARVREVLGLLSNDEHLPALVHCSAGKDRTGFVIALIQLLVGVPYPRVMDDYLLSNEHFAARRERLIRILHLVTLLQLSPERMRILLSARPELLDEVHGEIVERHGSVESYLRDACGIDSASLQRLKSRLLA